MTSLGEKTGWRNYKWPLALFQVRTLFVSGLPMDAKPRELYLLFRAYEVSLNYYNVIGTNKVDAEDIGR